MEKNSYVLLLFTLIAMCIPPDYGSSMDKMIQIIYSTICWLEIILVPLILITNFLNIRDNLPLFKRHRIGFTLLGIVAVYMLIGVVGVMATDVANIMYSEEYKSERDKRN